MFGYPIPVVTKRKQIKYVIITFVNTKSPILVSCLFLFFRSLSICSYYLCTLASLARVSTTKIPLKAVKKREQGKNVTIIFLR